MAEKLMDSPKALPLEFNQAVTELVKIAQQKKDDLDHQCLLAQNHLKQFQEALNKEKMEFDIWKREQRQILQHELDLRNNKCIEKENSLNIASNQIEKRVADLKTIEEKYKGLLDERAKLDADRIEVERIRVRGGDILNEANIKMAQANGIIINFTDKEKILIAKEQKLNDFNLDISKREDVVKVAGLKLEQDMNNLEELKKIVEPKIKEIDAQLLNIEEQKKDIVSREIEIKRRIDEDKVMLRGIEEREMKVKQAERELSAREEDLKRKIILLGNK